MTFYDEIANFKLQALSHGLEHATMDQARRALSRAELRPRDLMVLLSPGADPLLEEMAQAAHRLTVQHFGRTILLYTPLYLSNYCVNHCVYCGFNATNEISRRKLDLAEVEREAQAIAKTGLEHILILTGGSRQHSPVSYVKDCVSVLKRYFSSISIEIYPVTRDEYADLIAAGVDGLTIYQETYDEAVYREVHPKGPKRDYRFRIEAPERAAQAGMRTINIGALLGLAQWRTEAFLSGVHAWYLQRRFPHAEVSISCPRVRPQFGDYKPPFPVSDRDLVHIIVALRVFLPRAGLTISTRESAQLRDNLLRLGITKMSAGSSTTVGGHTDFEDDVGQFDVCDHRSVAEMRAAISCCGYKPVFKDWHNLNLEHASQHS